MLVKKDELAALRAAHSIEYESEDEYLKAMFECVVGLVRERDSWGVGIQFSPNHTEPYGPFYNKAQAKKNGQRYADVLKVPVFLQKLNAPSKLDDPTIEESK